MENNPKEVKNVFCWKCLHAFMSPPPLLPSLLSQPLHYCHIFFIAIVAPPNSAPIRQSPLLCQQKILMIFHVSHLNENVLGSISVPEKYFPFSPGKYFCGNQQCNYGHRDYCCYYYYFFLGVGGEWSEGWMCGFSAWAINHLVVINSMDWSGHGLDLGTDVTGENENLSLISTQGDLCSTPSPWARTIS